MPVYGLSDSGFIRKPYTQIIADKEERARSFFGENVDLSDRSPLGLFIQADSWEESKLWDELEKVYYSAYIDDADGKQLDGLVKYIGLRRKPAQRATGIIEIRGKSGKEINSGMKVMTESSVVFQTTEAVTLDGDGFGKVKIEASEPGRTGNVTAGKINRVFIHVDGVSNVSNPSGTSGGLEIESDGDLRARYYRSLFRKGKATREAVEAALLAIANIKDAYVRENTAMTAIDGIPPKSIAPYVYGGDEKSIAEAIMDTKSAGIQSYGEIVVEIADSRNYMHKIGYTIATCIEVYVKAELVRNSMFKPGHEQTIRTEIIKYIGGLDEDGTEYKGLGLGRDVMRSKIIALADDEGIDDVTVTLSIDGVNFSRKNIAIDVMRIAVTDFEKVNVV